MTVSCMYSENFRKSMKKFFNRKFVQKFTLFSLKPLIIFAIIHFVGNNFKSKIFYPIKLFNGGRVSALNSNYQQIGFERSISLKVTRD